MELFQGALTHATIFPRAALTEGVECIDGNVRSDAYECILPRERISVIELKCVSMTRIKDLNKGLLVAAFSIVVGAGLAHTIKIKGHLNCGT
jgi:hypothetical protein